MHKLNKNARKLLCSIFLPLILWMVIFNPPLISAFNFIHVLGFCSVGYVFFTSKGKLNKNFVITEVIVIAIYSYSLIVNAVNGIQGSLVTLYPIYWLVDIVPLSYAVWKICRNNGFEYEDFERSIIWAGIIAAVLSLLALVNQEIHLMFLRIVAKRTDASYVTTWAYRTYGLADNLTYSSPIAMTMIALFALNRMISANKFKYLLASVFMGAMSFVSARTSLVVFLCGTVGLLIINIKKTGRVVKIIIAILAGIFIAYNALEFYLQKGGYDQQLFWLLDGLKNMGSLLNENVESHYDATSYFFDARRLTIPTNIGQVLFGTGKTIMESNSTGVASDIGFINDIWYGGVTYAAGMYVLFVSMCYKIKKSFNKADSFFGSSVAIIFLAVMIVSNIKGIAFWFNDFTSLMLVVYMYIVNEEERLKSGEQYFSNGYMQNIQP